MTKYYHIHFGTKKIGKLINGKPLFLDKKDQFFNSVWKEVAKENEYDGYIEYSIELPDNLFTEEIKAGTNKILRITKNNKKAYEKILNELKKSDSKLFPRQKLIKYLSENNFIGIDMKEINLLAHKWLFKDELVLFNFDGHLNKLKIEEIVKF